MDNRKIQLHNVDFEDFIKAIDECKGDVYLETNDGDVLNLKSKLCQMIGLSTILRIQRLLRLLSVAPIPKTNQCFSVLIFTVKFPRRINLNVRIFKL